MRVVIIIGKKNGKKKRLLLELLDKKKAKEIKKLISVLKHPEAIANIIAKSRLIKEITEKEMNQTASDLILTDTNAYWSLL